jgi:hypothetical protein
MDLLPRDQWFFSLDDRGRSLEAVADLTVLDRLVYVLLDEWLAV